MTGSRAILSGLLLLLAVRVAAMIWIPLTDTTEARYAEIARNMVESGNWIAPLFDLGAPFLAEPPLHSWLAASGIAFIGVTAFAVRLGVLLAALATLTILWLWARSLADRVTAAVAELEGWIDESERALPALRTFVLPGGSRIGAMLHVVRTVARRAERCYWTLQQSVAQTYPVPEAIGVYLNRLSDLCFSWARLANQQAGVADIPWQRAPTE